MDQIYERVAGLDVHRDNVVACFRRTGPRGGVVFEKDRFATTTAGLGVLEAWLAERQVQLVAMEATGVYWKCAARRPVVSPAQPGGTRRKFLGPMAYPDPKGERDHRLPGNRRSCPGVRGDAPRDPRDMAKA